MKTKNFWEAILMAIDQEYRLRQPNQRKLRQDKFKLEVERYLAANPSYDDLLTRICRLLDLKIYLWIENRLYQYGQIYADDPILVIRSDRFESMDQECYLVGEKETKYFIEAYRYHFQKDSPFLVNLERELELISKLE